jgi:predicted transglutaminase-like cysteine proteinase
VIAAVAGTLSNHAVQAFTRDYSRGVNGGLDRIQFATPILAPFAHSRHCVQYPDECRVRRMAFRGGKLVLTEKRWAELTAVNAQVNRSIRPERSLHGVAGEEWLIAPKTGNCNDYMRSPSATSSSPAAGRRAHCCLPRSSCPRASITSSSWCG